MDGDDVDPEAGTRGPNARGGGASESGAGSAGASVTTGCGPRDGTRENGEGGPSDPDAARRAIGTGAYRREGCADDGFVRVVGGALAGEHLARHAGGGACPPSGGGTEGRLRARGAMQRDTGTVGACPTEAANAGATRIRVPTPGFVSSCEGAAGEAGARTADVGGSGFGPRPAGRGMTTVRSSGAAGVAAARTPGACGVSGSVGGIVNGSISSVSGRWMSLDSSRLVSPAGSSSGAGGTYGGVSAAA